MDFRFRFQISGFGYQISDSFQMSDFRFRSRISDLSSRVLTLQLKLQLVKFFGALSKVVMQLLQLCEWINIVTL